MIRSKSMLPLVGLLMLLLVHCSGDCEWNAEVKTWIDRNENGTWDPGESPLPGVKCFVESSYIVGTEPKISDEHGRAYLHAMLAGCPNNAAFFVYALPPPGYRPSFRTLHPAREAAERVYEFGFVPDEEYQYHYMRDVAPGGSFRLEKDEVVSIRGTRWKIENSGFAHYDTSSAEIGPIKCCEIVVRKDGYRSRHFSLAAKPGQPPGLCPSTTGHFDGFSITVVSAADLVCTYSVTKD